ncbi:MAG: hypothetical protein HY253_07420 [Burkholderiales bacterium]|nr:hypothetical protein [Burkholderiales bacterium]
MKKQLPNALFVFGSWRYLIALAGLFCSSSVSAQWSASAALASDYIYRGNSLSQSRPVVQLNANADAESGLFAGGFLSKSLSELQSKQGAQAIAYAGIAKRLASGIGWEVGVTRIILPDVPRWNYTELFAGMNRDNLNLRVHYSADYLGIKKKSFYLEMNGDLPLHEQWRLTAHGGILHLQDRGTRSDVRVGVLFGSSLWTTQLAWGKTLHPDNTRLYFDNKPTQLTLSLHRVF